MDISVNTSDAGLSLPLSSRGFRALFYLFTPSESTFNTLEEIPDYVAEVGTFIFITLSILQAIPFFVALIFMELLLGWITNKHLIRTNDLVSSISAGLFQQSVNKLFTKSFELSAYIWFWNNFHIVELSWKSPWIWILTMLGVDFFYYWFHRFAHEIHFMWAAHQVHHSSEDYNLSTALRQSVIQVYTSWVFYLPMALAIPPQMYAVHVQFNLLFQFWIHTTAVKSLGPFEWILNTPSHHRVHHGRNRYCIDKNYGATLIIWDRIFGTFKAETEEVVFGLTHPIDTWNPWIVQFHNYAYLCQKVWEIPGIANKLRVIFYGPGWDIGHPRLPPITEIPDVHAPVPKYDSRLSRFGNFYIFIHLLLVIAVYSSILSIITTLEYHFLLASSLWIIYSLTSFGVLLDNRYYGITLELSRCLGTCVLLRFIFSVHPLLMANHFHMYCTLLLIYGTSFFLWSMGLISWHIRVMLMPSSDGKSVEMKKTE